MSTNVRQMARIHGMEDKVIYRDLSYRLDFLIENKIVLELKAEPRIQHAHITQVLAYLRANKMKLGIVANFRTEQLTFKRIVNTDSCHS